MGDRPRSHGTCFRKPNPRIELARELALHIAGADPTDVHELLEQDYIRKPEKKVKDLVVETVAKLGENIQVRRFTRFVLGAE